MVGPLRCWRGSRRTLWRRDHAGLHGQPRIGRRAMENVAYLSDCPVIRNRQAVRGRLRRQPYCRLWAAHSGLEVFARDDTLVRYTVSRRYRVDRARSLTLPTGTSLQLRTPSIGHISRRTND